MATAGYALQEIRIDATGRRSAEQLADLWRARELTWMLARRDLQLRYRHSVVGIGWAVMQPLLTLLALSVFQRYLGQRPASGIPYALYAMTGLVPWTFFGHALTQSSSSVLRYTSVVKKVYLPMLSLPLAAVFAAAADLVVALPLVAVLMAYYGFKPRLPLLVLPLFVLLLVLFSISLGIWLALLNTRFRDTANALPFLMQIWFFLTPIAYQSDRIPEHWRFLVGLNPMVGILEGFRYALFGQAAPGLQLWLASSCTATILLLVSGVVMFLRGEDTLAESI